MQNLASIDFLDKMQQMQNEIDAIKVNARGGSDPGAGHGEMQERRRAQANGGGAGGEDANSAAVAVKQFKIDVQPIQIIVPEPEPEPENNGHRRAQTASSVPERTYFTPQLVHRGLRRAYWVHNDAPLYC